MGQCTGSSSRKKRKQLNPYWKQPQDTKQYESKKLNKLPFQAVLSHFVLQKSPHFLLTLKIHITGLPTITTEVNKQSEDLSQHWPLNSKIAFEKTPYQLRTSFVEIQCIDQDQQVVAQLKLNLYLVATGPYHQDFALKFKSGENRRISFDMKISQIIEIQLSSIYNELILNHQYPDEAFNFSIKTIIGQSHIEANSRKSYLVKVALSEAKNPQTNIDSQKLIPVGNHVVWSKKESQIMPSIVMKTPVNEIQPSYFQIMVWKFDESSVDYKKLFGNCYLGLNRMFTPDKEELQEDGSYMEERYVKFSQKLQDQGREVGKINMEFKVRSEKHIRQMNIMIRTEEGIKAYTPVTFQKKQKNSRQSPQLTQIICFSRDLQELAEELESKQNLSSLQSRRIKIEMENVLEGLLNYLNKASEKQNRYVYSSHNQLMKTQQTFIELGYKMVYYLQEEEAFMTQLCWKIMIVILKRSEFSLTHVGFTPEQIEQLQSNSNKKFLSQKIQIAVNFKNLLNKQLSLSLKSISFPGVDQRFSQIFLAHAYFRLPDFRNKLLQALTRDDDFEIDEWRGTQFSLHKDNNFNEIAQQLNTFKLVFDWYNRFHKCIEKYEKKNYDPEVDKILEQNNWKQQMRKRSTSFFYFIVHWVDYVEQKVMRSKDVCWHYFPGYNKIIKFFLVEMKKRSINQYPDAMKSACRALLSNQKLLNSIISIIIRKANLYSPTTLLDSIEFIGSIFQHLAKTGRSIHASFHYYQLYQAIKIILQGDFSFAVSKTLLFLYNNYKMFHLQFRRNISMMLMGQVFFKLFLHWSANVRDIFCHLFIIRIYRQSLFIDKEFSTNMRKYQQKVNDEIRKRYEELLRIIENAYSLKTQQLNKTIVHIDERNMVDNLRKKLQRKKNKRNQSNDNLSENNSQPPTPTKHQIQLVSDKYSVEALLLDHTLKLERSQSYIKIFKRESHRSNQIQKDGNRLNSIFLQNIYDITKGSEITSTPKADELIYKYEEDDFQIPKIISAEEVQYLESSVKNLKKIKDKSKHHFGDQKWKIPEIKMEMPLDGRESRPDKIDSW